MRFSTTIYLSLILFLVILGLIGPIFVQAQGEGGIIEIPNPLRAQSIEELIQALTHLIRAIALTVGPIMVVWGGIMIMTAGGSEEKVTKGKKIIMWTVIGVAVVILVDFMVGIIKEWLGAE